MTALSPGSPDSWRENVAAIIMDAAGRVLLGLTPGRGAYWHFPQGGVDKKESLETALRREVWEEVGLAPESYRIVARYGGLRYPYRDRNRKSDRWLGQEQTYFLLLCETETPETDCSRAEEFTTVSWVPWRELRLELFVPFKRGVVADVLAAFFPQNSSSDEQPLERVLRKRTTRRYRYDSAPELPLAARSTNDCALFGGGKEEMVAQLARLGIRLREAQKKQAARGGRLLVLLHGSEGAGRSGCARHLAACMDPLRLRFHRPAAGQDVLWSLLAAMPAAGECSVLLPQGGLERGAEDASAELLRRLEDLAAGCGVAVLKLYLNAAPQEGEKDAREADDRYLAATHGESRPWYVVPSDRRWYRDYLVATLVAEALELMTLPLVRRIGLG